MPPSSMAAARNASQRLLTQTAVVYGEDPSTGAGGGRYTLILNRSLKCRMVHPSDVAPSSAANRAEMMAERAFFWSADYQMPEQCRLLINGIYWIPRAGTFSVLGDGMTVVAKRCIITRQQVSSF